MKEYVKERMTFAIALLGVLLALHPFLSENKNASFTLLDISIKLQYFYTLFSLLLGISIYFYALQFVKHKALQFTESVGNYVFLIALIAPAAYLLLYICYLFSNIATKYSANEELRTYISIISVLISIGFSIYSLYVGKNELNRREVEEKSSDKRKESYSEIEKAQILIEAGIYEPAIMHIFNSIMSHLRNLLLSNRIIDKEVPDFQTIQLTKQKKLINKELMERIHHLRLIRNKVVHATEPQQMQISKPDAIAFMQLAGEILSISSEEPFVSGSPCQMSGQKCPACKEGVMRVSNNEEGVECSNCGIFIGTPPTSNKKQKE